MHKLTLVQQHRHRLYKNTGLIVKRAKRHFDVLSDSRPTVPANDVIYEEDFVDPTEPRNFDSATAALIAAAEAEEWEEEISALEVKIEARAARNRPVTRFAKIKLADLFIYPHSTATDIPSYWYFNGQLLDEAEDVEADTAEALQMPETDNV